jgi:hypothetical protein
MLQIAAGAAIVLGRNGATMTRWLTIAALVAALGLGLGACSASSPLGGFAAQANLVGANDDMCGGAGSQAAYAQCMQQRYASGSAGYDEESGHFAPGAQPRSLFQAGQ